MAAGPFSDDTLWTVDPSHTIVDPHDDVFLVFHKLSGDTHILNFLSAGIIEVLKDDDPANFQAIAERTWQLLELDESDCPLDLIKTTVLQLDDVGLVFPSKGHGL